jgi:hypothetical protein
MSHRSSRLTRARGSRRRSGLVAIGLPIIAVAMLAGGEAPAHHSFAATYLEDQTITIEGTVLQFQFRNPHSFVHIRAPDENGQMQRWAIEWASPTQLSGQGVGSGTLRPGDVVRVSGNPGRDPSDHRMILKYLIRPADGYTYGDDPSETFD